MPDESWPEEVGRRVVTGQIIVGALLAASIGFLAVVAVLVHLDVVEPDREMFWPLNFVLILFLIGDMIARVIVPRVLVAQGRRRIAAGQWPLPQGPGQEAGAAFIERTGDAGRLLCVYQSKTILASALLEGVAFFGIIVYLLTRSMVGPAVAIAMILGLVFHIPTRSRVVHWIEDQLQLVEQERRLRSS
jgi:hypothetical protein